MPLPSAALSLDLDNEWVYHKTHGDAVWDRYPSYLDVVVPRVLDALRRHALAITVFVVGQDAALAKNREALQAVAAGGHEIGNHSLRHEPWLHLYAEHELRSEIARADHFISEATRCKPRGFRSPGYTVTQRLIDMLAERGYAYDASSLPTFIGPVARAYSWAGGRPGREARLRRAQLLGSAGDALRPNKPYLWKSQETAIVELPVTTFPGLRVPIHFSYLMTLGALSPRAARAYFAAALAACRLTGTPPSLLLHPLDFLGCEDRPGLSVFPGMQLAREPKLQLIDELLALLCARFDVRALGRQADDVRGAHTAPAAAAAG